MDLEKIDRYIDQSSDNIVKEVDDSVRSLLPHDDKTSSNRNNK